MIITTNARNLVMKLIGDITGYPHPVCYHPKSITNMMNYSHLSDHYQLTYDNQKEDTFLLNKNKQDH